MPFPPPQSASSSGGEVAIWQVSVAVPANSSPADIEAAVGRLNHLDARVTTIDGGEVITLDVRAATLAAARQYAEDLVLSLVQGDPATERDEA